MGRLIVDIETCTEVVEVIVKGAPDHFASDQKIALRQAFAMISTRTIQAMQVRYRWNDAVWLDTVMWAPEGLKVVRMGQPV